ncbi:methyltransferase regulatory domain-containing protein [Fimbriiglobus ruber]|uniref:Methyltransferase n=1 Tax=Fimbriiglobus ruber TaxID=1908690 RepID=A0A225E563_9BACT|nr:class I SAM-dependent methyltransferase [Fimbriiglobus ruber]OWK43557.1 Methyltransferase [Fimbriiglobus ruber]
MSNTPAAIPPVSATYDEVPYDSHPFAQTHPSRLYVVGTLFGMRPTPVQRCRVLELGCAGGGNLIPMADYLPDSEFVGIDLSERQIKTGTAVVDKFGLKNVALRRANILDIDESFGTFDYVIAHGVFSWVPAKVQDKIFDICAKLLTPNGIAYLSYNTYPGWHMRGMIRDMMVYHSSRFTTSQLRVQQARALLDFLAQSVRQDNSAYALLLKQELENVRNQADHYLLHEHLEEVNEPIYFHQFAERARAKGLTYLGEARVGTMVTGNFGPEIEKTLKMLATDQIQAEQYMDFLRNRMFRESLLCLNRVQPNWAVNPECLRVLHVSSAAWAVGTDGKPRQQVDLKSDESVAYRSASGLSMSTNRPLLKAAMQVLGQIQPGTMPFDVVRKQSRELIGGADSTDPKTIAEDTQVLAIGLLNCYMGSDLIELHGMPITFARAAGPKPTALPLARYQAERQPTVTNRRHEAVRMNDLDRHLLPLLDGTNDRPALIQKLTKIATGGLMNVQKDGVTLHDEKDVTTALTSVIDQALANIARSGLLIS